ncbi:alpha/beta hydrolase [Aliisedimentitalea scapharcae]|uniref:Alpha/beta hydrolase n=1 Tax=Aliisedimentitalea scapharcae TaxID=1524259 RepID=A0ABZ2XM72_9RHOB
MTASPAPFFADVAGGPDGGCASWVKTSDGVRIRVGAWTPENADQGTVLMFPGRTEYIEKYGDFAREMALRGLATLAVDWRGQGLADRLLPDRNLGHVKQFSDYQQDVTAALDWATELQLPRPWHLVGHSMGGAIGLRALYEGLPVASCCFSAPMWGIQMSAAMRPLGNFMTAFGPMIGIGNRLVPTTSRQAYVLSNPFEDNTLTTDPHMFAMMQTQLKSHPDLVLGGPTIRWFSEGVRECRALAKRPAPEMPCLTFLGSNERIVDTGAIHHRMNSWAKGTLDLIDGGEHEVMLETPKMRQPIFDKMAAHFTAYGQS